MKMLLYFNFMVNALLWQSEHYFVCRGLAVWAMWHSL